MPEGPELRYACNFVNKVCKSKVFGGKPIKSDVSKQSEIDYDSEKYEITAECRGKEVMLVLDNMDVKKKLPQVKILFNFGMSGNFHFTDAENLPKHAHLRFLTTKEQPQKALCFVDYRRFGRWAIVTNWSTDRGPDPVYEYDLFRQNILQNLDDRVFKKPICETLLNQKYFNGIGNYLRAEILYRAGIKPFEESLSILGNLEEQEKPDVLQLCHDVPLELMNKNVASPAYDRESEEFQNYIKWFQCYYQPGMYNMRDHNKRMIWFKGSDPGPLAPKKEKPTMHVEKTPKSPKKKAAAKKDKSKVKEATMESKIEEATKPKKVKLAAEHKIPKKESITATRRSSRIKSPK